MATETATKLAEYIRAGQVNKVQDLLDPVTDLDDIKQIENVFEKTDPINMAIDCKEEAIACYLVEKCFSFDKIYQLPGMAADLWSNHDDGSGKCPWEYDASDNAVAKHLVKVKLLIDSIRQGKRRPGETLHTLQPMGNTPKPTMNGKDKSPPYIYGNERIEADRARDLIVTLGTSIATKNNNTLLHNCITKSPLHVYVYANNGVPVNVQNKDGNTALHLAVRKGVYEIAESLLQCNADLSVRNKLGQTPLDEAQGPMKKLLEMFELGLVAAVCKGNTRMVSKLMTQLWCSVDTVVKEGKTIVELAQSRLSSPGVHHCLRILQENRKTSELTHAVLSEDYLMAKKILKTDKGWNVNSKFGNPSPFSSQDRCGKSLLSYAIDRNNTRLVQILVDHGARVNEARIRETVISERMEPLFHRCIRTDCPIEIAKIIHSALDPEELHEKDMNGNTPILRAIQERMSSRWIIWLLKQHCGYNLTDRNKDGLTPREQAACLGRTDIVQAIDKFVVQQLGRMFLFHLPVTFYGEGNTNVTDPESGKSLLELAKENKNAEGDLTILQSYNDIEERGVKLLRAAASGHLDEVEKLNDAPYKDKNGYTALTRALVFNQMTVASKLCVDRPVLKTIPDNCNRYPLHYAYALPEKQGEPFIRLLLERNPENIERRPDMDGKVPVEYKNIRDSTEILQMLFNARTLNAYGERESPPGPPPKGTAIDPTNEIS